MALIAVSVWQACSDVSNIIFMIFALDRRYRGDLALQSEPYQLIYDQLMKP